MMLCAVVNLALVLACVVAVVNARRIYLDVRKVVRCRESLLPRDCTDRLAIFSSDEIAELSLASARSTVVLTMTPDPWSESLKVKDYLLPVHANRLQDLADYASLWSDIAIIIGTAALGVVAGNWSFVKLPNVVAISGGVAIVVILCALALKLLVVPVWLRAADKYRELSRSPVERKREGIITLQDQAVEAGKLLCPQPLIRASRMRSENV